MPNAMITYDETWLLRLIFRLDGSVHPRSCAFAIPAAVLSFAFVLFERWAPGYRAESALDSLEAGVIWNMTTAVLIFMVGFRTRQAFVRFWEGTSLLHQMKGEWFDTVSNSTSFSIKAPYPAQPGRG